jgi:DNA topoisomerase-1
MDLEKGLRLINLPRKIGEHPEDGNQIITALGRFGPYLKHNKTFVSLKDPEDMFNLGMNRAVELIAEKVANPGRRANSATVLKEIGKHPESNEVISVMSGRYGPYIKYEKVNATLPKDKNPEDITLDMALEYIAAKIAKSPKKKTAKKKTAKKKIAKKTS